MTTLPAGGGYRGGQGGPRRDDSPVAGTAAPGCVVATAAVRAVRVVTTAAGGGYRGGQGGPRRDDSRPRRDADPRGGGRPDRGGVPERGAGPAVPAGRDRGAGPARSGPPRGAQRDEAAPGPHGRDARNERTAVPFGPPIPDWASETRSTGTSCASSRRWANVARARSHVVSWRPTSRRTRATTARPWRTSPWSASSAPGWPRPARRPGSSPTAAASTTSRPRTSRPPAGSAAASTPSR